MKAAYITQTGPAESIIYGDLPIPEPTGSEVRVKTSAVAVNPVDTNIRSGAIQMPLRFPFIVGCDVAGVVEKVGPHATRFKAGDRVWGSNQGLLGRQGTFAEYVCIDDNWLYPSPAGVPDEDLAATALVGITAHLGLVRDAKLQPGETLFINGGSGGVGSMVVQIAKILGARVVTTASSAEKIARCRSLGADYVIDYKMQDVLAETKRFAANGVNVYWDTTREPDFQKTVEMLAERGRMILMAGRDARPTFPVGPFYVKGCSLHGFVMFKATPAEQRSCAEDLNRWLAAGKLKAPIDRIMPFSETAAAHKLQEENTVGKKGTLAGKIVLRP